MVSPVGLLDDGTELLGQELGDPEGRLIGCLDG